MSLQALDSLSVHRLASAQVVIDLPSAVKELVENALDASATQIEVVFRAHGVQGLEVRDDGRGIPTTDWATLGKKHATSKLGTFDDLTSVATLGFRGEALSSLCALSKLEITTATEETAPKGTVLSFEEDGTCVPGRTVGKTRGTTVSVTELFRTLPVRRKDLERNAKAHFGRTITVVQAYALIHPQKRFIVSHFLNNKSTVLFRTTSSPSIIDTFGCIYGPKASAGMHALNLVLEVEPDKQALKYNPDAKEGVTTRVEVTGIVSKPVQGCGRSAADRQYYYLNNRPFNPSKISKTINDLYRTFLPTSSPSLVLNFVLPTDSYDVNVSPDKRTIFLHSEDNLVLKLREELGKEWEKFRGVFTVMPTQQPAKEKAADEPVVVKKEGKASSSSNTAAAIELDSDDDEDPEADKELDPVRPEPETKSKRRTSSPPRSSASSLSDPSPPPPAKKRRTSSPALSIEDEDADGLPVAAAAGPSRRSTSATSSTSAASGATKSKEPKPVPLKQMKLSLTRQGDDWDLSKETEQSKAARKKEERERGVKGMQGFMKGFLSKAQNDEEMEEDEDEVAIVDSEENDEDEIEMQDAQEDEEDELEVDEGGSSSREISKTLLPKKRKEKAMVVDVKGKGKEKERAKSEVIVLDESDDDEGCDHSHSDSHGHSHSNGNDAVKDQAVDTDEDQEDDYDAEMTLNTTALLLPGSLVPDRTLSFNLDSVRRAWERTPRSRGTPRNKALDKVKQKATADEEDDLEHAGVDESLEVAEQALTRNVSKTDFARMEIVGQFNLGFIIARRKSEEGGKQDDLFIVDQHAADEKTNFEMLQKTTRIESQRLIKPIPLHLSLEDELVAMDNVDSLNFNGFEVSIDEDATVGQRVKVVAMPVSKSKSFTVADLEELLHLLKDAAPGQVVRPSETRKMFASRACRMSVMIGKALPKPQMAGILRNMGTMDQPWSCPHGRPTMRWLADMAVTKPQQDLGNQLDDLLQQFSEKHHA